MVKGMPKRPIRKHTPLALRTVVVKIRLPWWSVEAIRGIAEAEMSTFSYWVRVRVLTDPRIQAMNPAKKPRKPREPRKKAAA